MFSVNKPFARLCLSSSRDDEYAIKKKTLRRADNLSPKSVLSNHFCVLDSLVTRVAVAEQPQCQAAHHSPTPVSGHIEKKQLYLTLHLFLVQFLTQRHSSVPHPVKGEGHTGDETKDKSARKTTAVFASFPTRQKRVKKRKSTRQQPA